MFSGMLQISSPDFHWPNLQLAHCKIHKYWYKLLPMDGIRIKNTSPGKKYCVDRVEVFDTTYPTNFSITKKCMAKKPISANAIHHMVILVPK
jgi:hypothetical protein